MTRHQGYVAHIWRIEPETRWFHRHILRRDRRLVRILADQVQSFELSADHTGIANLYMATPKHPTEILS